MQDLWYGDKRDRVKWGAIVVLARDTHISNVVQVAYYRETTPPKLNIDGKEVDLPQEVWEHFSNLKDIENLGEQVGIKIDVIDEKFVHSKRSEYLKNVIKKIQQYGDRPLIIFLDHDTGIALKKSAGPEHATIEDVKEVWRALKPCDWLIIYQHAGRENNWLEKRREMFKEACDEAEVKTFQGPHVAKDVAFFAAMKSGEHRSD